MLCIWPSGRLFSSRQNTQKKKRDTLSSTSIVSRRRRRRFYCCVYFYDMWRERDLQWGSNVVWSEQTFQQLLLCYNHFEASVSWWCTSHDVTRTDGMGKRNLSTVLDNQTKLNTENTSGDRNSSPTTKKNLVSRLGSLDKGELSLSLSLPAAATRGRGMAAR